VLPITFHDQVLAGQAGGDELLNLFGRGVGHEISLDVKNAELLEASSLSF
jgi:hypothetical protein